MSLTEHSLAVPAEHEKNICGQFDSYMKKIERSLRVTVVSRDGMLKIVGPEEMVDKAEKVIRSLLELSMRGSTITEQNVDYTLALVFDEKQDKIVELDDEVLCRTINGKPVKPKTLGQKDYVDAIDKHMITFGIGPAGTGKTYLAMAMAVKAFKNDEVSRIIMTRPAIEAGEKLGFLPGDLQSKVDPYLRPLYDALYQMMGAEATIANMEKGLFEVAPLAYMRGRTLDNAFIILDEAQNTTSAQMKMFLTRIGFGSKVVVTGDATQRDLDPNLVSGLDTARKILRNVEGISFIELTAQDIVRHPLVQKIVEAYEAYEKKEADLVKNRQERRREQFGDSGRNDQYGDGGSRRDSYHDGRRDERPGKSGYPGQGRSGNRT
ncbi:MAG: PhoH family protein [Lachnospiraceae bacterium]|nr:PhoH family protein [Lachnospiraceae bacterium]